MALYFPGKICRFLFRSGEADPGKPYISGTASAWNGSGGKKPVQERPSAKANLGKLTKLKKQKSTLFPMPSYPRISLDDTVIVRRNLMLMENVTNLEKPAIDYYHFDFSSDRAMAMPQMWDLLLRLGKYQLVRLPSCSAEDDVDYQMYVKRLHHCLWRRWSIAHFGLADRKLNPLDINWNKEQDVSVLYGPDLSLEDESRCTASLADLTNTAAQSGKPGADHANACTSVDSCEDFTATYGSSMDSRDSSIFDSVPRKSCLTSHHVRSARRHSLHFNNQVLRRDIDKYGDLRERKVFINDAEPNLDIEFDSEYDSEFECPRAYSEECFLLDVSDNDSC
ncbi:LAQU0S20e00232g1_1 [Lachancea quebecensis]|uniref:LAQU0S20e00232g1_1 n=1 Tax=Lachancea quebecensis TaxID=1654605 RepID=A0A0P1KWY5_9SACH|nr:LAQU0S20e00232g1_1 [Lachancea quebecensis]